MIDEKKLIKQYLKMPYEELEVLVKDKFSIVHDFLLKKYNIPNAFHVVCGVVLTCVAADLFYSTEEWELINKIMGKNSYDTDIKEYVLFINEKHRLKCEELIEFLPRNIKEELLDLCIIVLCIDGKVNEYELTFLNKLLK